MPQQLSILDKKPGTAATANVDWWVVNDAVSAEATLLMQGQKPINPETVKVFIDHDTPCGSVDAAVRQKALIRFAEENGCELFNGHGISHQIMLDRFVRQGDVVAGCFSFPAMYGAAGALGVPLTPEALAQSLHSGSVAVTVPAKKVRIRLENELIPPASEKDLALFLRGNPEYETRDSFVVFGGPGAVTMAMPGRTALCQMLDAAFARFSDDPALSPDATVDLGGIVPLVAGPDAPEALNPAAALSGKTVNEVFIGGCSGGRIEDLRLAASILAGRRVPARVRLMIAPATTGIYRQAADEGLLATFLDAGAILMNQGCSVCWGTSQGLVDDGEVLLSTGSRNHNGCAGADSAEVYLCSPGTAAHSALAGTIIPGTGIQGDA